MFSTVFTVPTVVDLTIPTSDYIFPMDSIVIDFDGVLALIDSLKSSSSCEIDNINSKFLRNTRLRLTSSLFLTLIFQQSLDTRLLPDDWLIGKVIPVHKSGVKNSPLN